ncbi:MAG: phosphatase PAP2 family protein [Microvirga sp.]
MTEALAQRNGIIGYFRALLYFDLQTHPHTYYLVAAALRIGQFLCMYYKGQFNRPRPVRLDPSLLPPIDPPGHSSYPSGHATQSFLIARCLEQVVPVALGSGQANQQSPFWLLAERIAKLREVLGVHYPSDTLGGQALAESAFPLMLTCARVAGTAGPDLDGDGVPDNQLKDEVGAPLTIVGQPIYDNGWLALARKEWEPRQ